VRIRVRHESDIVAARRQVRELGARQGLSGAAIEALATAVTEMARNLVVHAGSGEVLFATAEDAWRRGVVVTVRDDGPGIADIEQAMQDGFSTKGGGLGSGLPGARRLVDEFHIESDLGSGTTITMQQWAASK
jgi:serine/threonine-protein kinase RsbT